MKPLLLFSILLLVPFMVSAQSPNPDYNPELAEELGADDYGMKWYVLVMLKTGKNTTADADTQAELFAGHMSAISRLSDEGTLVVAGPLEANERTYRGIFIFDVETLDEARELLKEDPAVREGLLDAELFRWYGSAALREYLEVHRQIQKVSF